MKKQLMSYVLAFILTASLSAVVFATDSIQTGGNIDAFANNPSGIVFAPDAASANEANQIVSRITQVFNYAAGILVSVMNSDRQMTVFDQGRVRSTYGYNSDG